MSQTQQKGRKPVDFSQRWVQHLRENAHKTTITIICSFCRHRPSFNSEDAFWRHTTEQHADQVPLDSAAAAEFKSKLLSKRSTKRPAELPPTASLETGDDIKNVASISPLTIKQLTDTHIAPQFESQGTNVLDQPAGLRDPSGKPPRKKRGIGQGSSPESSVDSTSEHNSPNRSRADSNRPALLAKAPGAPSVPTPREVRGQEAADSAFQPRAPTTGKSLFDPQSHSTFGQTSPPRVRQRQRQVQQRQGRKSQPLPPQASIPPPQTTQKELDTTRPPGFGKGIFPTSALNTNTNRLSRDLSEVYIESPRLILQPVTRPISEDQLVAEVRGIYAGLVMVEGKCIQVDLKQAQLAREAPPGQPPKLNNDQWQALIALHRTLLHEHHDFFLASQHPTATDAVRSLAIRYAMPARLWKHGIHAFLELLRNRLPDCLDHMLAFIYLAYNMMTLLYETVPAFKETWIECLGDLGRYRMAIEDDDIRDREVWSQVARQWYVKASNRSPKTGRLYHHLAILARPNALQQLYYYGKALSVDVPFLAARESILTLFEPMLASKQPHRRFPPVVTAYIKIHAVIFTGKYRDIYKATNLDYVALLDKHIERVQKRFLEQGYFMAISNIQALLSYGNAKNPLMRALAQSRGKDTVMNENTSIITPSDTAIFTMALQMFYETVSIVLNRLEFYSVMTFLHCTLVFLNHLSSSKSVIGIIEQDFPWQSLATTLNSLLRSYKDFSRIEQATIPRPAKDDFHPFREDIAMWGLFWTLDYYPEDWFNNLTNTDDENEFKDDASVESDFRPERILWLGHRLASRVDALSYNTTEHKFFVPSPPPEIKAEPDYETAETDTATMLDDVSMTSRTPTWKSEISPSLSQTEPPKMMIYRGSPKGSTWGSEISETGSERKGTSMAMEGR